MRSPVYGAVPHHTGDRCGVLREEGTFLRKAGSLRPSWGRPHRQLEHVENAFYFLSCADVHVIKTYHSNRFQAFGSVALPIFTLLRAHHHHLLFPFQLKLRTRYSPSPQSLATTVLLSVYEFDYSRYLSKKQFLIRHVNIEMHSCKKE